MKTDNSYKPASDGLYWPAHPSAPVSHAPGVTNSHRSNRLIIRYRLISYCSTCNRCWNTNCSLLLWTFQFTVSTV